MMSRPALIFPALFLSPYLASPTQHVHPGFSSPVVAVGSNIWKRTSVKSLLTFSSTAVMRSLIRRSAVASFRWADARSLSNVCSESCSSLIRLLCCSMVVLTPSSLFMAMMRLVVFRSSDMMSDWSAAAGASLSLALSWSISFFSATHLGRLSGLMLSTVAAVVLASLASSSATFGAGALVSDWRSALKSCSSLSAFATSACLSAISAPSFLPFSVMAFFFAVCVSLNALRASCHDWA